MFVVKYILDDYISVLEAKTQAQEKISQLARLREESKLKHITHMHKIEEEREKEEQRNAEARADIKRKRDAADLEEVRSLFVLELYEGYCVVLLLLKNQERRRNEFEANHNRKVRETEQEKKKARLDEEEKQLRQRKLEKEQQEHQLEIQNMAFESEMHQQRKAWLFEKERTAYNDRRKHTLDGNAARAAEEKGAELFRREGYLAQSKYDRRIHSSARTNMISEKRYSTDYGNKKDTGAAHKEESDESDRGTPDNPQDDGRGDEHDDVGGNDEDGNGERPSFNPFLD